jgi:AcrR family transcriptional regulator
MIFYATHLPSRSITGHDRPNRLRTGRSATEHGNGTIRDIMKRRSMNMQRTTGNRPARSDRRADILDAAIDSFGTRGYYGTSLQKIATAVGLTKAGVLHYVASKEGLLELVLNDIYDSQTSHVTQSILQLDRPLISRYWRATVAVNAERPQLVHMFSTLSAEALDPHHPAHDYFEQREQATVSIALSTPWSAPAGVDCERLLRAGFSMMDGIQLRWLRTPGKDLNAMWADCEDVLFPLPLWDGYR